jgi:sugar lactone lactonase YvrE
VALARMGSTNGIEFSPDGRTLYVNEFDQRQIWAFDVARDGSLKKKRLIAQFPDHGLDGMRCDVEGSLYVARWGKGSIAKLSPEGKLLREVHALGAQPTNLCFGGPDGCTAYVTEAERRRLVSFRVERPGAEWQRIRRMQRKQYR